MDIRSLALCAPLALAAGASADVVRFDNHDAAFPWGMLIVIAGSTPVGEPYLDITRDATQDGTVAFNRAFVLQYRPNVTSGDWSEYRYAGHSSSGLRVATDTPVHVDHWWYSSYMDLVFTPPRIFHPGQEVGPTSTFGDYAVRSGTVRTQDGRRVPFSFLPESRSYYIGVRFTFTGGGDGLTHYGWVRVHEGALYEWAYETQPDVPITIPGTACPADWNLDGDANSQDFFDYLNAFFASLPSADFNADETVNSQDFFDFIGAFFAGC